MHAWCLFSGGLGLCTYFLLLNRNLVFFLLNELVKIIILLLLNHARVIQDLVVNWLMKLSALLLITYISKLILSKLHSMMTDRHCMYTHCRQEKLLKAVNRQPMTCNHLWSSRRVCATCKLVKKDLQTLHICTCITA